MSAINKIRMNVSIDEILKILSEKDKVFCSGFLTGRITSDVFEVNGVYIPEQKPYQGQTLDEAVQAAKTTGEEIIGYVEYLGVSPTFTNCTKFETDRAKKTREDIAETLKKPILGMKIYVDGRFEFLPGEYNIAMNTNSTEYDKIRELYEKAVSELDKNIPQDIPKAFSEVVEALKKGYKTGIVETIEGLPEPKKVEQYDKKQILDLKNKMK